MSEIKVNSVVNSTGDNDSGLDLSTNDQVIIKTANTTAITVDSSQNLNMGDDKKIKLGDSGDLEIYHDTVNGNSVIHDTGSGNLRVRADDFQLTNANASANLIFANDATGEVKLYHNGSEKVATNSTGINVNNKIQGASGESLTIESQTGGAVIINTNGSSERVRITSAGDCLLQTSSTLGNATLHVDAVGSTYVMCGRASSAGGFILWQKDDGTTIGSIDHTSTATRYLTSSDYRLKENVSYDFDATTRLKQLKPCRFNFKTDKDIIVDGFLAHEVSSIVPESVSGEKDAMTKEVLYVDGDEIPKGKKVGDVKEASVIDPQGIDQSKLVPLLVKTIQELEARITALEKA